MKSWKKIITLSVLGTVFLFGALSGYVGAEDSIPSSKAAANILDLNVLNANSIAPQSLGGWEPIISSSIKTANQKDLFVDVSLQSALYTSTTVRSKDMKRDTSSATAGVKVRVLVDGQEAQPGVITFNARNQELSATLQGQLDLVDKNGDGVVGFDELQSVNYEEISLLLSTISANSFNFIMPNVTSGVHSIVVEAKIETNSSVENGSAEATALIGAGSVTVEEVGMVNGNNVELQ